MSLVYFAYFKELVDGADDSSQDVHTAYDKWDVFAEVFVKVFGGEVGAASKCGHNDDWDGERSIIPRVVCVTSAMEPAIGHCLIAPFYKNIFMFFGPCGFFGCAHLKGCVSYVFK